MPRLAPARLMPAISRTLANAAVLNAASATNMLRITETESVVILTCLFRQGVWELLSDPNSCPIVAIGGAHQRRGLIAAGWSIHRTLTPAMSTFYKASDFVVTGSATFDAVSLLSIYGAIGWTSDS